MIRSSFSLWQSYLSLRGLPRPTEDVDAPEKIQPSDTDGIVYHRERYFRDGVQAVSYPENYGVAERDAFVRSISRQGFGGESGHDVVIIALDAILGTGSWEELVEWTMLHGGDTPATGAVAGGWYGALYGFEGVPMNHYDQLEYATQWDDAAAAVFRAAARSN